MLIAEINLRIQLPYIKPDIIVIRFAESYINVTLFTPYLVLEKKAFFKKIKMSFICNGFVVLVKLITK